MGAFGRVLIQNWGGNLTTYDKADTYRGPVRCATPAEMETSRQNWHDRRMAALIYHITDKIVYGKLDLQQVDETYFTWHGKFHSDCWTYFLKWKENRLQKGYSC
jgi:hypothetical protein